eukprot:Platyproteum_vivax@DN10996_c0_g1_i1.p1
MSLSVIPFIGLFCFGTQYAYPLLNTVQILIDADENDKTHSRLQWLVYWVMCCLFSVLETYVLFWAFEYFPLYLEVKTLGFMWLVHPDFKGALYIWQSVGPKYYKEVDAILMEKLPLLHSTGSKKNLYEQGQEDTQEKEDPKSQ